MKLDFLFILQHNRIFLQVSTGISLMRKCSDTIDVKQFIYKNSDSSSIIELKTKNYMKGLESL